MTATTSAADLFTLAALDGKEWRPLLEGAPRAQCCTMRDALGLRASRVHRAGRVLRDKLPHTSRPSREYAPAPVARYIAWLDADPRRVAYVYPWTPFRRCASDEARALLEKRGPVVEFIPECIEETEP